MGVWRVGGGKDMGANSWRLFFLPISFVLYEGVHIRQRIHICVCETEAETVLKGQEAVWDNHENTT